MTGISMHSSGRPHFPWADGGNRNRAGNLDGRRAPSVGDLTSALQSRDQGNLEIRTAEGDTVSISFDAQSRWAAAFHQDGEGGSASVSSSNRIRVQVRVEGNLSDTELADIQKLVAGLTWHDQAGTQIGDLSTLAAYRYGETESLQAGSYLRLAA